MLFGLFKLTAYALLGYVLYEFFRGLTTDLHPIPHFTRHEMDPTLRASVEHEIQAQQRQRVGNGRKGAMAGK